MHGRVYLGTKSATMQRRRSDYFLLQPLSSYFVPESELYQKNAQL